MQDDFKKAHKELAECRELLHELQLTNAAYFIKAHERFNKPKKKNNIQWFITGGFFVFAILLFQDIRFNENIKIISLFFIVLYLFVCNYVLIEKEN